MTQSFETCCKDLIVALHLGKKEDIRSIRPLTGGVSSDIGVVDLGTRKICVKFALPQLKVSEQWYAKVERNQAEYQWLKFVSRIAPDSTPRLLGSSIDANGFAMEFIDGPDVYLWKNALLEGWPVRGEAPAVGRVLGKIHQASTLYLDLDTEFQNQTDFHALRLDPYLIFTAKRHPGLNSILNDRVACLETHQKVLVHGDVSPKNILFRKGVPLFLDAECATIGDPCFDIAFCLNHLVLKAVYLSENRSSLLMAVEKFWQAYQPFISWEKENALEKRVAGLLPALMLARVDGKSPVEYLSAAHQDRVRKIAIELLQAPVATLAETLYHIQHHLENESYEQD